MRSVGRWVAAAALVGSLACGNGQGTTAGGGGASSNGSGGSSGGSTGGGAGGGTGGSTGGGTGGQGGGTGGGSGGQGGGTGGGSGGQGGGTGGGSGGQGGGTGGASGGLLRTFDFPKTPNWSFYGPQNGGPQDVFDVTMDEGGNLWVAGGSEGLFLMRADSSGNLSGKFEKFGIADGLHPYGWVNGEVAKALGVPDGTPADKSPSLSATPVISVAGGPAGTVYVGYQGKTGCEWAWAGDQWTPAAKWGDPSVYKSGDADRVTLAAKGISVVHYDIFSGPGVVPNEIKGREKLCSVYRIAWDKARNAVWFGGNHGFAVARADAPEAPTCDGEPGCDPVWEHSHPAISGCSVDYDLSNGGYCPSNKTQWLTDGYYGVAVDPTTHDMWIGGTNRTTKFHSGGGDYYSAQSDTEGSPGACSGVRGMCDRWDLWPDNFPEWDPQHGVIYVSPSMRTAVKPNDLDDNVSGIAALPDGTAWVASSSHGLIHIDSAGTRLGDATAKLMSKFVSGVAYDPSGGGSIWAGLAWGFGISRLDLATGNVTNYSGAAPFDPNATLGDKLSSASVAGIQSFVGAQGRSMLVGFHQFAFTDPATKQKTAYAGAVAVYRGN